MSVLDGIEIIATLCIAAVVLALVIAALRCR